MCIRDRDYIPATDPLPTDDTPEEWNFAQNYSKYMVDFEMSLHFKGIINGVFEYV